jgi:hypothetical protein
MANGAPEKEQVLSTKEDRMLCCLPPLRTPVMFTYAL